MTGLSGKERKAALIYIRRCLDVLRLSDWDIILSDEPADRENHAEINAVDSDRYIASLYLPPDWARKSLDVKRSTLMHEAIHVLHAHQEQAIKVLEDQTCMSKDVYDLVYERYRHATEYMVDKLTRALDAANVLPEWPTAEEVASADMIDTARSTL